MAELMEFIDVVKEKLAQDRTEEVLEELLAYFKPIDNRFYNSLILQTAQYNRLQESMDNLQLTQEAYNVQRNRLNRAVIGQIDRYYKRSKDKKRDAPLKAMPSKINMVDDATQELTMEALIGKSDLSKVSWLAKGLRASKSVCIVARDDGATGTGFLVKGGFLLTNNHVLKKPEQAAGATLKFDYEEDVDGKSKMTTLYKLNPGAFFQTDPKLDFTLVKVEEMDTDGEIAITDWGNLVLGDAAAAVAGEYVTVIQHPQGRTKEIAFDRIADVSDSIVKYRADTEGGSSGSPVFDLNWKVIALHHGATSTSNQGTRMDVILGMLNGVNLA